VFRYLRTILLALILGVSATALAQGASGGGDTPPPRNTISFGVALPPYLSVTYQRDSLVVLDKFEFGAAARLVVDPQTQGVVSLTPMAVLGWYDAHYNVVLEVQVPKGIVPVIGESQYGLFLTGTVLW